jgi:riboflavin biosynthesis pyrimidine reductase
MRPKISCHMVSSIDGRLHPSRFSPPAIGVDPARLRPHYDEVASRFGAAGWMVGRTTMQEISKAGPRAADPHGIFPRDTFVANRNGRDLAVAIDPQGKVHYATNHLYGDHVVAILGERVPDSYLAELRAVGVSYLFAGADGQDLPRALATLGEVFGVASILLEGGARTNALFLKLGLIDEISLLIQPAVDGLAGVSSIFEYPGQPGERPAANLSLRHLATETLEGGTVWLRYAVDNDPGTSS